MKNRLVEALALTVGLWGCGGGGGSGDTASAPQAPGSSNTGLSQGALSSRATVAEIAGVDSNGDGIRDDVEQAIDTRYSASPAELSAARALAKAIQSAILAPATGSDFSGPRDAISKSVKCMTQTFKLPRANTEGDFVEAQIVNTEARVRAYLDYNLQLPAYVSSYSPAIRYCD